MLLVWITNVSGVGRKQRIAARDPGADPQAASESVRYEGGYKQRIKKQRAFAEETVAATNPFHEDLKQTWSRGAIHRISISLKILKRWLGSNSYATTKSKNYKERQTFCRLFLPKQRRLQLVESVL